MALTFEQLETVLTPSAGKLRVGGAALQTPLVQVLFDTYLTGGRLDLFDATAVSDPATRAVTVDGTLADGTFLGLEGADVPAARFQLLADGSVHARVEVSVTDEDWKLPASFDALADTVLEQAKSAD